MNRWLWLMWAGALVSCVAFPGIAAEQQKADAARPKTESGCAGCCQSNPNAETAKTCAKETPQEKRGIFRLDDAAWRLEITGSGGLPASSESSDRGGDGMLTGTVDYEIPIMAYGALGLRMMPLFLYFEDQGDVIWGAGGGIAPRLYTVKNEQRGFYIEGEALVLLHDNKFRGDSSYVDFITGGGIGYQCKANWHAIVKFEHISNAGLGGDNDGVNTVGIAVGYTF